MPSLQDIAICPNCTSKKLRWEATAVICDICLSKFRRNVEFVDFVENNALNAIEAKALEVWGDDLHKTAMSAPAHFIQIQSLFPDAWPQSLNGNILEIGCGSGTDTIHLGQLNPSISIFSFDLGLNVEGLSRLLSNQKNTQIFRANALNIPIQSKTIDMVYSFGVFHHTQNVTKCFKEAYRVLNKKGVMFFYLYSAHEDNPIKYLGIFVENWLMQFLSCIPKSFHNQFFLTLSIPCLLLFSWPAQILKCCGLSSLSRKFPMYWGTNPASILPDLKDRLLAPVNHRLKEQDLKNTLKLISFAEVHIKKTSAGIFAYCVK